MQNVNQSIIEGYLVKDPSLSYVGENKKAICKIVLANHHYTKNKETKSNNEETSFFHVTAWGKMGENCNKYLIKGSKILLTGTLRQKRWTSHSGEKKSHLYINATQINFLPNKKNRVS